MIMRRSTASSSSVLGSITECDDNLVITLCANLVDGFSLIAFFHRLDSQVHQCSRHALFFQGFAKLLAKLFS